MVQCKPLKLEDDIVKEQPLYRCYRKDGELYFEEGLRLNPAIFDREYCRVEASVALKGAIEHIVGYAYLDKVFAYNASIGPQIHRRVEWCNIIHLHIKSLAKPSLYVSPADLEVIAEFLNVTIQDLLAAGRQLNDPIVEKLYRFAQD